MDVFKVNYNKKIFISIYLIFLVLILVFSMSFIIEPLQAKTRLKNQNKILDIDPIDYSISKSINYINKKFNQKIPNPIESGFHIISEWDWDNKKWEKIGFEFPGPRGEIYKYTHSNLNNNKNFNGIKYFLKGNQENIRINSIPFLETHLNTSLGYHKNKISFKSTAVNQEYLTLGLTSFWGNNSNLKIGLISGKSLNKLQSDYWKYTLDYSYEKDIDPKNKLLYSLHTGTIAGAPPLNHQFKGGGFSKLPLRGHNFDMAGDRYLIFSLEYHHNIINNLESKFFIDTGKIIPLKKSPQEVDWAVDGGFGLRYDTSLGKDLILEAGFDLKEKENLNWRLGLEDTF